MTPDTNSQPESSEAVTTDVLRPTVKTLIDALTTELADEIACAIVNDADGLDLREVTSKGHIDGHPQIELRCAAWSDQPATHATEYDCADADGKCDCDVDIRPLARIDLREYSADSLVTFVVRNLSTDSFEDLAHE
jgi:hypothetical protein